MRKLIVNADDFGFNQDVTDGILECHKNGCVTSTTLMTHMPAAEYAAERSKSYPELSVGIHFSINTGRPLSAPEKIPSLVDSQGNFKPSSEIVRLAKCCKLPIAEVEVEFTAQMEKCLEYSIEPSHCDSHQNISVNPQPFIAMMRVVKKYNIKKMRTYRGWYKCDRSQGRNIKLLPKTISKNILRSPKVLYYEMMHNYLKLRGYKQPDEKYGFYKVVSEKELGYDCDSWIKMLQNLPHGISEFVTHPGLMSNDPLDREEYRARRVMEYKLFSDPETINCCKELNVDLVNFNSV